MGRLEVLKRQGCLNVFQPKPRYISELISFRFQSNAFVTIKKSHDTMVLNSIAIPITVDLKQIHCLTIKTKNIEYKLPFDTILKSSPKTIKSHKYTYIRFKKNLLDTQKNYDINMLNIFETTIFLESSQSFEYKLYVYGFYYEAEQRLFIAMND